MPREKQFIVNHQENYAEAFVFERKRKRTKLIAFVDCEAIRNYQVNHQINKCKKIHKSLRFDITSHKNTPLIPAKIGCPNKTSENIMFTHKTLYLGEDDGTSKDTYK